MTKRAMSRRPPPPIDRGRERYERGNSPDPYRYDRQDPRYRRSPPNTPRSPDDYHGRRDHLSPRSAGHRAETWLPRRPRSRSRSRSQHRRSSSRGPPSRPPAGQSNRSRSRGPRNGPPSPREHHRSTSGYGKPPDPREEYRGPPRSPATATNGLKGPENTRPWGSSGNTNTSTAGPSSGTATPRSHIQTSRPVGAFPPGPSSAPSDQPAQRKRPRSQASSPERRSRPERVPGAASDSNIVHQHTATSSGSAAPSTSALTNAPRGPAAAGPSEQNEPPQKRSKSAGPSNKAKGSASGGEQDAKARGSSRNGGDQSSREKGKPTVYHPRVEPAILNLVKANYALYNAEARVDKFRLETVELEKCLGEPVKDMTPEDQESLKELINEFGQKRDIAKKERDNVVLAFRTAARPALKHLLEELFPGGLAEIARANSVLKIDSPANPAEIKASGRAEPTIAAQANDPAAHEPTTKLDPQGVDEPRAPTVRDTSADTPQLPLTSAAEVADVTMIDQALRLSDGTVPMDVDSDKPEEAPPQPNDLPVATQPVVQSTSDPSAEPDKSQQAPTAEQPPATGSGTIAQPEAAAPETQSERRLPAVRRLKNLESGLEAVSSTTEELVRKVEKIEEQVLYQEEQLNDYLDTRGLMEAQHLVEGKKAPPPAVLEPQPAIPIDVPAVQPSIESGMDNMATVEAAREEAGRAIDEKFEALAKAQDLRLAELAQLQETRLTSLGNEIRSEIQTETRRAEEAYDHVMKEAEERSSKLEAQLAKLKAELAQFKQDRSIIEDVIKRQDSSEQLLGAIRESTLKFQRVTREVGVKAGEAENQLQTHHTRLAALDQRVADHATRLNEHEAQIAAMSPFEDTKEAWRSDMIDMKNHVVGRVDYLEDQVESIKQPLVAANLATQPVEPPNSTLRGSSPGHPAQSTQPRPLTPQTAAPAPVLGQSTSAPALSHLGLTMPSQGRASPVDGISNRLSLNRLAGLSPTTSSPAAPTPQPAAAMRPGFSGQNGVVDRQQGAASGQYAANPVGQSQPRTAWPGPLNAPLQTQPGLARANGHPGGTDMTSESALANRLYTNQQQRPEPAQGSLPLHLRMHNGPGAATGNWMQGGQPAQPVSSTSATGRHSPAGSESAAGASLLSRMFDPGESKPAPP